MLHISALRGMLVADTTYKLFGVWNFDGQDEGQLLSSELVDIRETLICK